MSKPDEQVYNDLSKPKVRLSSFVISLDDLRKLWGDDVVDKRLANGTIKILNEEEQTQNEA